TPWQQVATPQLLILLKLGRDFGKGVATIPNPRGSYFGASGFFITDCGKRPAAARARHQAKGGHLWPLSARRHPPRAACPLTFSSNSALSENPIQWPLIPAILHRSTCSGPSGFHLSRGGVSNGSQHTPEPQAAYGPGRRRPGRFHRHRPRQVG